MTKEALPDESGAAIIRANLSETVRSGLAGKYHRLLLEHAKADIDTAKGVDVGTAAYLARRALQEEAALEAEIPLVFRRVHERGNEEITKGLEIWKLDPATGSRVPDSGVVLAFTDESGGLVPKEGFDEEDIQLALARIQAQNEAGIGQDGPPGFAIVPQSLIDAGIE